MIPDGWKQVTPQEATALMQAGVQVAKFEAGHLWAWSRRWTPPNPDSWTDHHTVLGSVLVAKVEE